jgi:hypothetical protein
MAAQALNRRIKRVALDTSTASLAGPSTAGSIIRPTAYMGSAPGASTGARSPLHLSNRRCAMVFGLYALRGRADAKTPGGTNED